MQTQGPRCTLRHEKDDDGNEIRKFIVATKLVFHKPHIDGNYYEQEFGDYVPRDTMLAPRVRVEFFNAMMHGSTIKMDQDVRILWMPKKRAKQSAVAAMQYFSDGEDDEPTEKRKREDDDDRAKRVAH